MPSSSRSYVPTIHEFFALEDPDDPALEPAAFLDALDPDDDAVAVHRLVQMRPRDVDVAAVLERPLRRHESVPRRVRLQPADVQIHLLGQTEALAANLDQLAGGDQGIDVPLEGRAFVARNLEQLEQLTDAGGMVHPLAHQRENVVAGQHGNSG